MTREVYCVKLKMHANGLNKPPLPGDLGKKIYENISEEAWKQWIVQQTKLINENKLVMSDTNAQQFLMTEMQKFLFGDDSYLLS